VNVDNCHVLYVGGKMLSGFWRSGAWNFIIF